MSTVSEISKRFCEATRTTGSCHRRQVRESLMHAEEKKMLILASFQIKIKRLKPEFVDEIVQKFIELKENSSPNVERPIRLTAPKEINWRINISKQAE